MKKFLLLGLALFVSACSDGGSDGPRGRTSAEGTLFTESSSRVSLSSADLNSVIGLWESEEFYQYPGYITIRIRFSQDSVTMSARCKIEGVTLYAHVTAPAQVSGNSVYVNKSESDVVQQQVGDQVAQCEARLTAGDASVNNINGVVMDSGMTIKKIGK
jgi:hypothetical protein